MAIDTIARMLAQKAAQGSGDPPSPILWGDISGVIAMQSDLIAQISSMISAYYNQKFLSVSGYLNSLGTISLNIPSANVRVVINKSAGNNPTVLVRSIENTQTVDIYYFPQYSTSSIFSKLGDGYEISVDEDQSNLVLADFNAPLPIREALVLNTGGTVIDPSINNEQSTWCSLTIKTNGEVWKGTLAVNRGVSNAYIEFQKVV